MDDKRQKSPSPAHQWISFENGTVWTIIDTDDDDGPYIGVSMDKTIGQAASDAYDSRTRHGGALDTRWEYAALAAVKHALAQLKTRGWELKPRKSSDQMCRVWGFNTPDVDWEVMFNAAPEPDIEALLKEQK